MSHSDRRHPSLPDPYDSESHLDATCSHAHASPSAAGADDPPPTAEEIAANKVESALVRAVFGGSELRRRSFMRAVGAGTASAILSSILPIRSALAALLDESGLPEKTDLQIGFIPITCATPIIMAEPLGFYQKHGLNAVVRRASGWAMVSLGRTSGLFGGSSEKEHSAKQPSRVKARRGNPSKAAEAGRALRRPCD